MSLSETNKIDITARSDQGEIILVISVFQDWMENHNMLSNLDKKLKNYIKYIEGDQYIREYGNSPVLIQIVSIYQFPSEVLQFIEKVQSASGVEIRTSIMDAPVNPFA